MKRIEISEFDRVFDALHADGFRVIGPRLHNQAIIYDELRSSQDLPKGWTDEQEKGHYRLRRRDDNAYFGYNVGPHSWKQFLFVPREKLWSATKSGDRFEVQPEPVKKQKTAFLGVRACELAAIAIQDKVFTGGKEKDGPYQARRQGVFLIAVNCTQAGKTCFCTSMNTGPRVSSGFDLAVTEVIDSESHYFLCKAGSEAGEMILAKLSITPAAPAEIETADQLIDRTAASMGRKLDTNGIKEVLYENLNHARWDEVADRCLSCANCTMVCPTCFCSSVEDVTDLSGDHAERWRRWDSCFTLDHSYIHGGNVHASVKSRYRQWMTHKLGSWIDQFGTSGCVGCGRCVTWCPVGIDLTEEAAAIREKKK